MAVTKYLASVLSAAATAYAASCSSSSTMTVQNGGDASAIGSCSTYSGSIAVATGASTGGTLDFGNVQDITGTLTYQGDNAVQTIKANSLQSLGGLNLQNLTQLSALNMGSLDQVGAMTLESLSSLSNFDFGTGVSKAGVVTIVNTQVSDISAISQASQIQGLVISDNQFLSNITFNLKEVGIADIGPNNNVQGMNLMFPQLATAESLTFRNATAISTPVLMNVTNTLGVYGGKMQSYGAPNLTWVGALVVNDNSELTNLSFPQLQFINSTQNATLQVANNTKLENIDGFSALTTVNGNVDFSGVFNNLTITALKQVAGAMFVDTSSTSFQCKPITDLQSNQVVKGADNCTANDANPSGTTGQGGSGTSGGSGSSSSSGAAVPLAIPAFATGAGLFGGLLAFLL